VEVGAYAHQRLNLAKLDGPRRKGQGSETDSQNTTVRDYRGALGNVTMVKL